MVDFPMAYRSVTRATKPLRDGDGVGLGFTKVNGERPDAELIGSLSSHQASAGGVADRDLAVSAIKLDSLRREFIDIGSVSNSVSIAP